MKLLHSPSVSHRASSASYRWNEPFPAIDSDNRLRLVLLLSTTTITRNARSVHLQKIYLLCRSFFSVKNIRRTMNHGRFRVVRHQQKGQPSVSSYMVLRRLPGSDLRRTEIQSIKHPEPSNSWKGIVMYVTRPQWIFWNTCSSSVWEDIKKVSNSKSWKGSHRTTLRDRSGITKVI